MEDIGSSEWLIYMHRGEVKVKEGRRDGLVFRPKGSRTWMTTCPPFPNVLYKGAMRVEKEENIRWAKTLVLYNYAFNHFDPRKINNKCKECKYLKVTWHNEDHTRGSGECMEIHRRNWENIRGRFFSNQACMYFEKKEEENMTQKEFDKTIDAMNKNISDMAKLMDKMDELIESLPDDFKDIKEDEKLVEEEPSIPEETNIPTNKYGLGQTLYLPVKVVGIKSRKTTNGDDMILYELSTATDQRMGFKIFNHVSDIQHDDKDHYMTSIPERYILDHFKEG